MLGQQESLDEFQHRYPILYYAIFFALLLLLSRVFFLQVYRGSFYREFSERNFLRREKIPGPRGQVFDRQNRILVDNRLQLDISITPQFVKNPKEVIYKLSTLLEDNPDRLFKRYQLKARVSPRFQPITLIENATWENIVKIESFNTHLPGVDIESRIRRTYLHNQIGGHLYGYLSEISEKEIEQRKNQGDDLYEIGDWLGRSGLESRWESFLKGTDGVRYVAVNAHGHRLNDSRNNISASSLEQNIDPKNGNSLILTLDADLQLAAARAMKGKMGAVVAMNPRTGEILAMQSNPSFNPTEMSNKESDIWTSFTKNPWGPLRNKTIQDHFAPGSTFKVFTVLAALKKGIITEHTKLFCGPTLKFGTQVFHEHKKEGFGTIDVREAIMRSSNVFMYQLAQKLDIDDIATVAKDFGLGSKTGIFLPNETAGIMPSSQWKKESLKESWYPGETLSVAIGQGYVVATPLQLAQAYSIIANGGLVYRPFVVSQVKSPEGKILLRNEPELIRKVDIDPNHLKVVRDGLYQVVNTPGGTAYRYARIPEVAIAGKSGTSQVMRKDAKELFAKCDTLPFERRHHAWFVGFAPAEKPEIVVAVLGMHECGGSIAASPVVKAIVETWWHKKNGTFDPRNPQASMANAMKALSQEPLTARSESATE